MPSTYGKGTHGSIVVSECPGNTKITYQEREPSASPARGIYHLAEDFSCWKFIISVQQNHYTCHKGSNNFRDINKETKYGVYSRLTIYWSK